MIDRSRCPHCLASVYATADSHNERVDCQNCNAELVTKRDLAGTVTIELVATPSNRITAAVERDNARLVAAIAELPTPPDKPSPDWQERVFAAIDKDKEPK